MHNEPQIPECEHRGKILKTQCFCRHPQITGPGVKSRPVSFSQCQVCLIPTGQPMLTFSEPLQLTGGPGTKLIELWREKHPGIPPCQECRQDAAWMDSIGIEGCKQNMKEIVEKILPRARKWADQGFLTKYAPDMSLEYFIKKDIRKAIRLAEKDG